MSTCWDKSLNDISTLDINKLKRTITILFNHEKTIYPDERVHSSLESVAESVCSNDLVHIERHFHNRQSE